MGNICCSSAKEMDSQGFNGFIEGKRMGSKSTSAKHIGLGQQPITERGQYRPRSFKKPKNGQGQHFLLCADEMQQVNGFQTVN